MFDFLRKAKRDKQVSQSFLSEFRELKEQQAAAEIRFQLEEEDLYPCLDDKTSYTPFDRHYIYHPAWAARVLKKINPAKHIDISSTLHFCSVVSAFIPVDFYDYRPANLQLDNFQSLSADLINLPFQTNSLESVSCMHTVEHIGLGRYGDPIDYDGDVKAINELKRVVKPGGHLLFVVPLGNSTKICFNAHRIYSKGLVLSLFQDLELRQFCLIPENGENGGIIEEPSASDLEKENYGCGCFWFQKPAQDNV